jgi:hypothetical protein
VRRLEVGFKNGRSVFPSSKRTNPLAVIIRTAEGKLAFVNAALVRGLSLEEGFQLLLYSSGRMTKENTEARSVINEGKNRKPLSVQSYMYLLLKDARKLANRLSGLPLAIVMAGSFISQTGVSHYLDTPQ